MSTPTAIICLAVLSTTACWQGTSGPTGQQADAAVTGVAREDAAHDVPVVVFLGDSFTAGLGVEEREAFPAVCGDLLRERGLEIEVVNAGVSGDTSAGGLSRLAWVLRRDPDVLVVELGGNDGLRGLATEMTRDNLVRLVTGARQAGAEVLLLAMELPPSYGPEYVSRFREIYPEVARRTGARLVNGFLDGVGGVPQLNLADGLHPNARGHRRLAANIAPHLLQTLQALKD
jgi:acyl-CoA thioesterase-1